MKIIYSIQDIKSKLSKEDYNELEENGKEIANDELPQVGNLSFNCYLANKKAPALAEKYEEDYLRQNVLASNIVFPDGKLFIEALKRLGFNREKCLKLNCYKDLKEQAKALNELYSLIQFRFGIEDLTTVINRINGELVYNPVLFLTDKENLEINTTVLKLKAALLNIEGIESINYPITFVEDNIVVNIEIIYNNDIIQNINSIICITNKTIPCSTVGNILFNLNIHSNDKVLNNTNKKNAKIRNKKISD